MLTIKMLKNKDLVVTVPCKIYQRQSLVDNMQILVYATYEDYDLTKFTATLDYIDAANVAHTEILEAPDEDLYKDVYIRYVLPVDSKFTYMAGKITMKLTLSWNDVETNKKYILRSGELELEILPLNDYFAYVDIDSLNTLDNKIMTLQTETEKLAHMAEIYQESVPTDLSVNEDSVLQLVVNGEVIGQGVSVASVNLDTDGTVDGILDLETATDSGVPQPPSDSISIIDL